MPTMTLTEALARHKLTLAKISDATNRLQHYLVRDDRLQDPLLKADTTSEAFVAQQRQSISDLCQLAINIRRAIAQQNRDIRVTFGKLSMSIEDALCWRREIAPLQKALLNSLLVKARESRTPIRSSQSATDLIKWVVSFDEKQAMDELEQLTTALAELDMQLSIVNATHIITV